jgi:DNA-binding transcriptional LysR family regulator
MLIHIGVRETPYYYRTMDIVLAQTFLEVAANGSFIAAAQRLHVTQTAVSARIRALEELLGRQLFIRNKAGARLTHAGERFARDAATLVQLWERARNQAALPPGREDGVSVGGELSLWHPLLADWLIWMHRVCPEIALRVQIASATQLADGVQDGSLDLAVLYDPPQRPGLVSELLVEEKLIMVTSDPSGRLDPDQYVYLYWGPHFALNHQAAFPELGTAPVSISLGPLALTYLLSVGGAGYCRAASVLPHVADGRLFPVSDAPRFSHSAYAMYARQHDDETLNRIRNGLRTVAAGDNKPAAVGKNKNKNIALKAK